jgi:hypothetical protein
MSTVSRHSRFRSAAKSLLTICALLAPAATEAEDLPPRFREAADLFLAGDFRGCQVAFGEAVSSAPREGLAARAAYGAACCAALRGDVEGGFTALDLALAHGFVDLDRALADPRLGGLRNDPRWPVFIRLAEERQIEQRQGLDPDLLRLYLEKQREGGLSSSSLAFPRDGGGERILERRREAWELVGKGKARLPEDAFHAAALLVESDRPEEVERAQALARQAFAGNPDLLAARPLVATAVDRGEMLAGRPQKYGTQLVEEGGALQLYPVDPNVTDAERAEWGVPPLAQSQAGAAALRPPVAPAAAPKS